MQITIEGTTKEIADLVSEVQNRLLKKFQVSISTKDVSQAVLKAMNDNLLNPGSATNTSSYYEEIIKGQRKAINMCELMIANTTKNAGMTLAYIGTSHPAFEVVFKYFVHQNYPDLKKRLLLPGTNRVYDDKSTSSIRYHSSYFDIQEALNRTK